jgi:Hint domain
MDLLGHETAGRSSSARTSSPTLSPTTKLKTSCFLPATRIKTTEGEINIEELRIGDNVLTA